MIEKLTKVLELCYEISTTTDTDVFFKYFPHCGVFDVDYHIGGWTKNKDGTDIASCAYVTEENLDRTIAALEELKETLREDKQ